MPEALTEEDVEQLAGAGAAAPSGGNAQPWRLVASGDTLELRLDPERSESFMDVDRSASILALGSFVENVVLEARARGLEHRVALLGLEDPSDPSEPLVRVVITGRGEGDPPPLHAVIRERATNRKPWDGEVIPEAEIAALRKEARSVPGHDLRVVAAEEDKRGVARELAEADVVRTFDRRYHEQMISEMRWTPEEVEETADGLDVATLELPGGALKGLKMMRYRAFVALMVSRERIRTMTEEALMRSSHLGSVTMPREATPTRLLEAGRSVQRMWLKATELGLALQPWCVIPFFVLRAARHPETLREADAGTILRTGGALDRLWEVPEDRRAIFTFRLSRAEPPTARALRRPWDAFTTVR